jgi:chromate transporter
MTPGPIAVNSATFVGIRIAGFWGAVIATFGCILPSCFIVSVLAFIYRKYKNASEFGNVMSCLRPVVVALIASAGISILKTALFSENSVKLSNMDIINGIIFVAALIILRKFKCNPIFIMSLCGVAGLCANLLAGAI